MTRPSRYLVRMILFLTAVAAVAAVLAPGLEQAFMANPALNGLILGVFLLGVLLNFRQVLLLKPEVEWLESWMRGQPAPSGGRLRLLGPMAGMLGERQGRMSLRRGHHSVPIPSARAWTEARAGQVARRSADLSRPARHL